MSNGKVEAYARKWMSENEQIEMDKGITPVEFLITTFRDDALGMDIRMEAAKSLLPYTAKRAPQAVEVSGPNGGDVTFREKSAIRSKLASMLGIEED